MTTHCPRCKDGPLEDVSGDFDTGVVAPDGGRESRYEEGYQCDRCGLVVDADAMNNQVDEGDG